MWILCSHVVSFIFVEKKNWIEGAHNRIERSTSKETNEQTTMTHNARGNIKGEREREKRLNYEKGAQWMNVYWIIQFVRSLGVLCVCFFFFLSPHIVRWIPHYFSFSTGYCAKDFDFFCVCFSHFKRLKNIIAVIVIDTTHAQNNITHCTLHRFIFTLHAHSLCLVKFIILSAGLLSLE